MRQQFGQNIVAVLRRFVAPALVIGLPDTAVLVLPARPGVYAHHHNRRDRLQKIQRFEGEREVGCGQVLPVVEQQQRVTTARFCMVIVWQVHIYVEVPVQVARVLPSDLAGDNGRRH